MKLISVLICFTLALSAVLISCQMKDVGSISSTGTPSTFTQKLTPLEQPKHYRIEFTWPAETSGSRNPGRSLLMTRSFRPALGAEHLLEKSIPLDSELYTEDVADPGQYSFTLRDPEAPASLWDGKAISFTVPEDCVIAPNSEITERALLCGRLYLPKGTVRLTETVEKIDAFQLFASPMGSHLLKALPEKIEKNSQEHFVLQAHAAQGKILLEVQQAQGKVPNFDIGWNATMQTFVSEPKEFSFDYKFPDAFIGKNGAAMSYIGNQITLYPKFRKFTSDIRGIFRLVKPEGYEYLSGSRWFMSIDAGVLAGFGLKDNHVSGADFQQSVLTADDIQVKGDRLLVKGFKIRHLVDHEDEGGREVEVPIVHPIDLELERVHAHDRNLPPAIQTLVAAENIFRKHETALRAQGISLYRSNSGKKLIEGLGNLERFYQLLAAIDRPSFLNYSRLDRRIVVDYGDDFEGSFGELLTIHPNVDFKPEKAVEIFRDQERRRSNQF